MKRAGGFTLLEVLVAMSLLALVMVAVLASMRTLGNTRTTLDGVVERVDEVRSVSGFLRASIGSALPVTYPQPEDLADIADAPSGLWFEGDSAALAWVAPLLNGARFGGAYAMYLERDEATLKLRWHPFRADLEGDVGFDLPDKILLDDVEEFTIGYLPYYGEDWQDEWEPSGVNPVAVRLNIKANGRYWPELVIALSGLQAQ